MMAAEAVCLDPRPASYDSYQGLLLSDSLKTKAKEELHEDESSRDSSIAQVREFIAKHPQIVRCRTDAAFLLMFLRSRKYNVVAACQLLESALTIVTQNPQCFQVRDSVEELNRFIDYKVLVPMGYGPEDQLFVVFRAVAADVSWMTAAMFIKYAYVALMIHAHEDRFQIGGVDIVIDLSGITMSYMTLWTMADINLLMTAANKALPIRLRKACIVGLPAIGVMVINTCLSLASDKIRKRIEFHKSIDDLKAAIDESVLPDIYGGKQSLEEANERFRQKVLEQRERILKHAEMTIDLSIPNPNSKNPANAALQSSVVDESVIGSFRKLNVD
ncbi:clavesin-2-like isoform X1 [Uranotaenia lowii]|uniref:clavesin-2-like isoform X1 n=1 Tax=Uranotaenia lowii TaxID=190385 RepID=UPI00247914DE|nr:clavesin-2-like isoform X1 [Uranotaenia lowii]